MAVGEYEALSFVPVRRIVFSSTSGVEKAVVPAAAAAAALEKSQLEALPQDILIRIVCGVDHEDLISLFRVSKTIQEAAAIARQLHFEYCTPKKTMVFQMKMFRGEAPNAPRQLRVPKSILFKNNNNKHTDICVALFNSKDDHKWRGEQLIMHMN
ncbi:hypothetical protein DM860_003588 [Cuscuta australis]|uniref:F-box domain-containing protein n=1 Tax=Cuscuta australis TaxID=267555 RepID=A0A328DKP2_9ASTE|nr:hypothetical protein DM860_003588 [Cuscuta australis]